MTPDEFDYSMDQLVEVRNLSIDADARGHWFDAFKAVEAPIFQEAVRRMIEEDDHYPSPPYLRQVCKTIMNERLARAVQPPPPSGLSQEEYNRWDKEWRRQIVRGTSAEDAERAALEARSKAPQLEAKQGGGDAVEGKIIASW